MAINLSSSPTLPSTIGLTANQIKFIPSEGMIATNLQLAVEEVDADASSHAANTSNPHDVTASQVGNTTPQWNANQIQGRAVSSTAPTDTQTLRWNAGSNQIEWANTNSSSNGFTPCHQVIVSNSNWFYGVTPYNSEAGFYSHYQQNESATGRLDFGYFLLNQKLWIKLAGGGGNNGSAKQIQIIEKDTGIILISTTLAALLGGNSDTMQLKSVSTSVYAGKIAFVRFIDNDSGSGWAWMGFSLPVVVS